MSNSTPESSNESPLYGNRYYAALAVGAVLSAAAVFGLSEMGLNATDTPRTSSVEQCDTSGAVTGICEDIVGPSHSS